MDNNTLKESNLVVDLESGREEDRDNDPISGNKRAKNMLSRLKSVFSGFDGSAKGECSVNSFSNLGKSGEVSHENIELLVVKISGQGREQVKEKQKMSSKKAPKPPRPPKGPSLDTADLKLVKEISELAMKKRSRIEHIKALKKMKATKSSSSSNSCLYAMVVTLLFCLFIIFQGIRSRNSTSVSFQGSPEPAAAANGLISVQVYNNLSARDSVGASPVSPNYVEHVSGAEFRSWG